MSAFHFKSDQFDVQRHYPVVDREALPENRAAPQVLLTGRPYDLPEADATDPAGDVHASRPVHRFANVATEPGLVMSIAYAGVIAGLLWETIGVQSAVLAGAALAVLTFLGSRLVRRCLGTVTP